jgi:hypothetical protein
MNFRFIVSCIIFCAFPITVYAECKTIEQCAQEAVSAAQAAQAALRQAVPSGAVIAFDLKTCPPGWREYEKAHGRFIRGIDRGDPKVDPDGERQLGSLQNDQFKSHTHSQTAPRPYNSGAGNHARAKPDSSTSTGSAGGKETRPKNVALLYCRRN